jgi:hypothetical protein
MKKLMMLTLALGSMAVVSAPVALVAQAAPAAQPAAATAKPDFSGSWKLDLGKSVYGPVPSPNSETDVITQTGDEFKLMTTQEGGVGTLTYSLNFTAGGPEMTLAKDAFPANAEFVILTTKGDWNGAVLVIVQKATYQGMAVAISQRFTLSEDGKELTKLTNYSTGQGDYDTKTVYAKS